MSKPQQPSITVPLMDTALLVLRVTFGLNMALFHGWGKITGGPERWERLGSTMETFGIGFGHTFFGFMAGFSEFVGSILLVLGLFFRPAAALLTFTMIVAAARHLGLPAGSEGAGFKGASHALEYLGLYVALLIAGPGRYSLEQWWRNQRAN